MSDLKDLQEAFGYSKGGALPPGLNGKAERGRLKETKQNHEYSANCQGSPDSGASRHSRRRRRDPRRLVMVQLDVGTLSTCETPARRGWLVW